MIIIGAGMSGMLAAHFFRHLEPTILEKQKELPNNHTALLRFRSGVVSDLTGIPFKKVKVQKMISYKGKKLSKPNLLLNNLYSQKVSGSVRSRSIGNLDDCDRYIAPGDFINKLSKGLNIEFNKDISSIKDIDSTYREPIISTMPVHSLMKLLGYRNKIELKSKQIWTISYDIPNDVDVDVYQTVYYPQKDMPVYRVSITGRKVIAEFCRYDDTFTGVRAAEYLSNLVHNEFGISSGFENVQYSEQRFGKLIECDDSSVKDFIGWASREHNIYSLGRWGCHRQLLMDDVVKDIKQIDKLIKNNGYNV